MTRDRIEIYKKSSFAAMPQIFIAVGGSPTATVMHT